jgi:pyruvate dehydrogenase complex dehydrogenase (E1) component
VRGNGKIIQELEGTFRGAGWNVIKPNFPTRRKNMIRNQSIVGRRAI